LETTVAPALRLDRSAKSVWLPRTMICDDSRLTTTSANLFTSTALQLFLVHEFSVFTYRQCILPSDLFYPPHTYPRTFVHPSSTILNYLYLMGGTLHWEHICSPLSPRLEVLSPSALYPLWAIWTIY